MNADRSTKLLLTAIALALWANLLSSSLGIDQANADVEDTLQSIQRDLHGIAFGICVNGKIC